MDSPFKTPSKRSMSQMLPSSGSSSPFTPKRSKIKKISNDSVSRILAFDESNSRSPTRRKLDFLSFSQNSLLLNENVNENELTPCEQTTPVKIEQSNCEKNKILLSPSIKVNPKRFNIPEQDKNIIKSSSNKRSGSVNSTPSKKSKLLSVIAGCKKITSYFKPIQEKQNSITNEVGNHFLPAKHKIKEENVNSITKNCIKSEKQVTTPDKNDNINNIQVLSPKIIRVSSSHPIEQKTSPKRKVVKNSHSNKTKPKELNMAEQVTPKKNGNINNSSITSPRIIEYLENKVVFSGGDTYSRFIKSIVLRPEIFCFGKEEIMKKIESATNDELKIYGRLIARKHGWIRSNAPDGLQKYKELNLCDNFDSVLESLATKQLINTGILHTFFFIISFIVYLIHDSLYFLIFRCYFL